MGNTATKTEEPVAIPEPAAAEKKPKCKACCACPETKKVRDEW